MKLVQVRIRSGCTELTCWVESGRARAGDQITLKNSDDPAQQWCVMWAGCQFRAPAAISRGWHNNI